MERNTYRRDNINITTGGKVPIKAWTVGVDVEDSAMLLLQRVADLPFIYKHVAVMPDVHYGKGCAVGSVIPSTSAVSPAFVGADIGCGMRAVQTTLRGSMLSRDLPALRKTIEDAVPHGLGKVWGTDRWSNSPTETEIAWMGLEGRYRKMIEKNPKISHKNPVSQLGTMGSNNHFIEVCIDKEDQVWLLLHSGSRGVGLMVAEHFIRKAQKTMKQYYIELPDSNLSFFPEGSQDFDDYLEAVTWCQEFAKTNRELMMTIIQKALKKSKLVPKFEATDLEIDCHHNYVARENHFRHNVLVTRKGAVSARKGQWAIIPGSMGAKNYIVRGLGNPDSFMSASHGAGRKMSRTAAKQTFTQKDHRKATEGIECCKDSSVLDETPGAYKSIDAVMEAQKDLVEPVHTLSQVVCVKG
jgi:tRNA-splicing ligase RtcB